MVSMNRLTSEKRATVIASLVEGNSIRATCRMTGVAKNTVTKLLVDLGTVCSVYMDRVMTDLPCERIQADEIWSFVYSKQKNVPEEKRGEAGDAWTSLHSIPIRSSSPPSTSARVTKLPRSPSCAT
jgi:hypothetical protein